MGLDFSETSSFPEPCPLQDTPLTEVPRDLHLCIFEYLSNQVKLRTKSMNWAFTAPNPLG
ncbi:hypothetical protein BofuT4_uP109720.1 [Botrytis cinerea T4]|uniref:F-box domain-containing protein n=1 Tax=Botryotinia fuckeliana (strain T4) TaxID=999810 RepID=G2Y7I6_BOTF4|nr:hypothetical protein BofuT4_uP109720.1 [Botrytis cinerea T4]